MTHFWTRNLRQSNSTVWTNFDLWINHHCFPSVSHQYTLDFSATSVSHHIPSTVLGTTENPSEPFSTNWTADWFPSTTHNFARFTTFTTLLGASCRSVSCFIINGGDTIEKSQIDQKMIQPFRAYPPLGNQINHGFYKCHQNSGKLRMENS